MSENDESSQPRNRGTLLTIAGVLLFSGVVAAIGLAQAGLKALFGQLNGAAQTAVQVAVLVLILLIALWYASPKALEWVRSREKKPPRELTDEEAQALADLINDSSTNQ